ncbi:unnamed protein product [Amoebophrya sp. A120]|nr:unnamed protein product [Amoebophrya sp. A120]|eukprot:GSA120T00021579001.1
MLFCHACSLLLLLAGRGAAAGSDRPRLAFLTDRLKQFAHENEALLKEEEQVGATGQQHVAGAAGRAVQANKDQSSALLHSVVGHRLYLFRSTSTPSSSEDQGEVQVKIPIEIPEFLQKSGHVERAKLRAAARIVRAESTAGRAFEVVVQEVESDAARLQEREDVSSTKHRDETKIRQRSGPAMDEPVLKTSGKAKKSQASSGPITVVRRLGAGPEGTTPGARPSVLVPASKVLAGKRKTNKSSPVHQLHSHEGAGSMKTEAASGGDADHSSDTGDSQDLNSELGAAVEASRDGAVAENLDDASGDEMEDLQATSSQHLPDPDQQRGEEIEENVLNTSPDSFGLSEQADSASTATHLGGGGQQLHGENFRRKVFGGLQHKKDSSPGSLASSDEPRQDEELRLLQRVGDSNEEIKEGDETLLQLATLSWADKVETTGWAELHASIPEEGMANADLSMYMAGYLEGLASTERIMQFRHNANAALAKSDTDHHALPNIRDMFRQKIDNILKNSALLPPESGGHPDSEQLGEKRSVTGLVTTLHDAVQDHTTNRPAPPAPLQERRSEVGGQRSKKQQNNFWQQARYAFFQLLGIRDAFNRRRPTSEPAMSLVDLILLNSDGETPELETAYDMQEYLMRQDTLQEQEAEEQKKSSSETGGGDETKDNEDGEKPVKLASGALSPSLVMLQTSTSIAPLRRRGSLASSFLARTKQLRAKQLAARRSRNKKALDERAWQRIQRRGGRCSALVRLTDNNLFVGHTTFSDYSEMLRVFKYYDFPLPGSKARTIGFSSYPGIAGSTDDYYVTSAGLAVTETTISLLSDEPYDKIDDKFGVPDFLRIMVANRVAGSGPEWIESMESSKTGTYSSQWMVVDTKKFTKTRGGLGPKHGTRGTALVPTSSSSLMRNKLDVAPRSTTAKNSQSGKKAKGSQKKHIFESGERVNGSGAGGGLLMVLDQAPNASHSADMTMTLRNQGYWASYNRPWFADVREKLGLDEAEENHGRIFSRDRAPRANIFRATAKRVKTLEDMQNEMQRNRWPNEVDGGERNTPDHAIAARSDLGGGGVANGAVDSKVADVAMLRKLQVLAISGPTTDQHRLQPFSWIFHVKKASSRGRHQSVIRIYNSAYKHAAVRAVRPPHL